MVTKRCARCEEEKPATTEFFYSAKRGRHGLGGYCKVCAKVSAREWNKDNRDRHLAVKRASAKRTVAAVKRRNRIWYVSHAEYAKAKAAAAYWADPVATRAASRDRYAKDPLPRRATVGRRRARKVAASGSHTAVDIRRIFVQQRGGCYYCGADISSQFTVDHKVPLVRQGVDDPANLCCACRSCNCSKGTRTADEYIAYRLHHGLSVPVSTLNATPVRLGRRSAA